MLTDVGFYLVIQIVRIQDAAEDLRRHVTIVIKCNLLYMNKLDNYFSISHC